MVLTMAIVGISCGGDGDDNVFSAEVHVEPTVIELSLSTPSEWNVGYKKNGQYYNAYRLVGDRRII